MRVCGRARGSVRVRVAFLNQHATRMRLIFCGISVTNTFFDIISQTARVSGKKVNTKCVFETFLILRRIQRDIFVNVKTSLCKIPVIHVGI
jgi:hypothetical protein